ncbi:MAG TPA: DNA-3-methyladenine glycosylase 2 family protein [Patescibacteria group bacterium]|nr:DNA-3-methyladenine glycosylase 2 family protein [Patescibacteria group bacterium]
MPQAPTPKPPNFWHEGEVFLHDLPEIAKGIRALTRKHPEFKTAMKCIGKLPWKKQPDGFEGLVCIILGQQVSVAAAAHMAARLKAAVKNKLTPKNFLKLADEDLRAIGFSRQKMVYCRDLAQRIIEKKFDPKALEKMNEEEAMAALVDLKGIGTWSAEIYLMFCLGKADIWPAGDLGLLSGLQRFLGLKTRPDPVKGRKLGDPWAPYRTAASLIVWKA